MAAKVTDDPGPLSAVSFPTVSLARTSRLHTTCVMPTLPTPRCRVRIDVTSLTISPPCPLATLEPLFFFLPPACPLSAPPSHSLPSHMRATAAFVLLLAGISSPRPSFHYPPLSLPSQSLPSFELSPSASTLLSRRPLAAPLALSAPSSSLCLTSAELCQPSANAPVVIPTLTRTLVSSPYSLSTYSSRSHPAFYLPSSPSPLLRYPFPVLSVHARYAHRTPPPYCRGRRDYHPTFLSYTLGLRL
ncbi:hypothetical protein EDB85DRAFT_2289276 [Lactarius pseudohatsudake]|nr:hypothetical protein EDB85DRAFT_2289276 [Lactarius pseudohatsudake]